MNLLRNFEAIFVVTLSLACAASYALENTATSSPAVAAANPMQVVVVHAKRLTPEQKQALQQASASTTLAARSNTSSKI